VESDGGLKNSDGATIPTLLYDQVLSDGPQSVKHEVIDLTPDGWQGGHSENIGL